MYFFLASCLIVLLFAVYILNLPVFGRSPSGKRLAKIKALPLYKEGALQNQSPTPTLPEHISYWTIIRQLLKGNKNGTPPRPIPHVTPDFSRSDELKITWFGHSSYLIQVDGINILVDPVFSERPSPFQFIGTKRFAGTDFIEPEDFPPLDVILITHDHYDHLDYHAILKLKDKTTCFITALGVGAHLAHWGIPTAQLTELAWGESTSPLANISFTALPARHFSGRKFKRNQTLWSSFALRTKNNHLYIGADSGYDKHFKTIGETYGPFDLAILECGQYNKMWPLIHLFPAEVVQASLDLNARYVLPVHWGKYKLGLHDWDEPINLLVKSAEAHHVNLITPKLGQTFVWNEELPSLHWWLDV